MTLSLEQLRYPVGRFDWSLVPAPEMRTPAIQIIAKLPERVRAAVRHLSDSQLDTPYRLDGWTIRQVVHHLVDSHTNGYIRTKFGLTEDTPTIKPYDQDAWAGLADMRMPIEVSLEVLDGLHARWSHLWDSLTDTQFARAYTHPELGRVTLDQQLQGYAWHSRHHVAHITSLRQREGWGALG
jgi:hypothetical protein